jgi:hypothetical protein
VRSCGTDLVHCVKVVKSSNNLHTVHKTSITAPHHHRQQNQATSHEVLKQSYYIFILTMGIMMPETC